MWSRACAYAFRAMIRLARADRATPLKVKEIAQEENIPRAFLAKVLRQLARARLVSSSPGFTGGFRLTMPASQIALLEVVSAVDGLHRLNQCIAGYGECSEASACPFHRRWKQLRDRILKYLRATTLAEVVEGGNRREQVKRAGASHAARRTRRLAAGSAGNALPGVSGPRCVASRS